ncbi:hypothetical protein BJY27_010004 [Streptomyces rapamycinicus]|uniref:Glycosyl hydrolase n=2 Tax=Streptomyces rapamycinicus TaxID=1226757 RepID=A0A3L8RC07_STRRN|nr:hypothetical protein [Streptomyces rapamycinicus]RLV76928.1 glycosyl hydrolase [Streptomyces rapamycinicus NRRL 5491]
MHRKRLRLRRSLALLAGTLLTGTALTLTSPAADAVPDPGRKAAAPVFQQVPLAKGVAETGEPMSLAVLPDRSVLHTSRDGTLRLTDAAGTTKVAATLPVYSHDEEGLQGVGVDPGFSTNRFIYLYYAPSLNTPAGDAPERRGRGLRQVRHDRAQGFVNGLCKVGPTRYGPLTPNGRGLTRGSHPCGAPGATARAVPNPH